MKILVYSDFTSGVYYYRFRLYLEDWASRRGVSYSVVEAYDENIIKATKPDIVFFQQLILNSATIIELTHKYKAAVYYDLDDYPFVLSDFHPLNPRNLVFADGIYPLIFHSDYVTVSTPHLLKNLAIYFSNVLDIDYKTLIGKLSKRLEIRPNYVRKSDYVLRPKVKKDRVRIGFMGAVNHIGDLPVLLDALYELQKAGHNFEFYLFGFDIKFLDWKTFIYNWAYKLGFKEPRVDSENQLEHYIALFIEKMDKLKNVVATPWVPPSDFHRKLSSLDFDIGVAPLAASLFNESKTPLKFYEYVMVGTPCVASNVIPYSDECNYLADNTVEDWYLKLEKLIIDEKFREELWNEQYKWVLANRVFNQEISDKLLEKLKQAVAKYKDGSVSEEETDRKG